VEVVAAGIGELYAPFGIVRRAKAKAKATIIRAEADGEAATISHRVAARLVHREAIRQENIEKVASIAAGELPPQVSSEPVDTDWTLQFLDHAQDICDEQLQVLWARILAGEVASPGSYSKRTLDFLRTLDKWEAMAFTDFCSLALEGNDGWRFVFHNDIYYEFMRAKFEDRAFEDHFASIGLLQPSPSMPAPSSIDGWSVTYFGRKFKLVGPPKPDKTRGIAALEIPLSTRTLTMIGQQLAQISGAAAVDGYIDRLAASMQKESNVRFEPIAS